MEEHLIIDWEKIHLYNSLMALVAGASFLSLWKFFKALNNGGPFRPKGWAINFGVLGAILFITGVHTTLTWPLAPTYPFDNTVFGEPCFVFGALLLAMSFYLWKQKDAIETLAVSNPKDVVKNIIGDFSAFNYIILGIGLAVIMLGIAGARYRIFIAPPEEPIVGPLAVMIPHATTYLIAISWVLVGIAAIAVVFFFNSVLKDSVKSFKWLHTLILFLGINFMGVGVMTYYTHVGMIVHTMHPNTVKPNVIDNPHNEEYVPWLQKLNEKKKARE